MRGYGVTSEVQRVGLLKRKRPGSAGGRGGEEDGGSGQGYVQALEVSAHPALRPEALNPKTPEPEQHGGYVFGVWYDPR